MRAFLALLLVHLSNCITLLNGRTDIISKTKVELSPMLISCGLNDIVIIAAPVVDTESLYYLYKPNGDVIHLNLRTVKQNQHNYAEYENMVVKYINSDVKSIFPIRNRRVISTLGRKDVVKEAEASMNGNEFMIGPLMEEDHGNWVLSVYFKDVDDGWMEMFKVITIEVVEIVPLIPKKPRLVQGDTFRLSFAYPIKNLTSCELTAPRSTYDRFFDRSKIELDRCGYVVKNVTKEDEGIWRIIGVGNMVFEGRVTLHVMSAFKNKKHGRHPHSKSSNLKSLKSSKSFEDIQINRVLL